MNIQPYVFLEWNYRGINGFWPIPTWHWNFLWSQIGGYWMGLREIVCRGKDYVFCMKMPGFPDVFYFFSLYSVLRGKNLGFSSCKHVDSSNKDGDLTTKHKRCTGSIFGVFKQIWTQFQVKIFKARRGCSWSPAPVNDLICFGGSLVVPWWFLGGSLVVPWWFEIFAVGVHVLLSIFETMSIINNRADGPAYQQPPVFATSVMRIAGIQYRNAYESASRTNPQYGKTITILTPRSVISLPFCRIKVHHLCWNSCLRDIFPMFDRYFWRYSKNSKHGFLIFLPRSDQRLAARCSRPRKLLLHLPLRAKAARAEHPRWAEQGGHPGESRQRLDALVLELVLDSEKLPKSWPPNLSVLWLLWYENHGEMTLMDTNRLIVDYKLRSTWFYWLWRSPEL